MSTVRSALIRLAHSNPELRPHLLPLLKSAAVAQPRSGKPVYEGNAIALPLDWGTSGVLNPDKVSQYLVPLYRAAKNGVAFVLDQRGVLTRAGLPKLARALESDLSNLFGEDAAMTSEYYEWATKADPEYQNITSAWNRAKMAENIRVMITPVVSPATGKSGLKVSFSIPVEKLGRVASVREARVTQELIRVKYMNLGDFGGTDPIEDSWVLEVAGPTFDYRDEFKRLGLRWNTSHKTWGIDATLYKFGGRRNVDYAKNRKLQEAAYPVLQGLAKKHNETAEAANRGVTPGGSDDTRELVEHWRRVERMMPKLEAGGVKIEHSHPGRYDVSEGTVTVSGNTFPLVAVMKKYGWRWNPSKKAWEIPGPEFFAVQDKWMGDVVRVLPSRPQPEVSAVFSEMSQRELADWISDHFDGEDLTQDGERSETEGIAYYMGNLKRMTPETQQRVYAERTRMYRR